MAIPFMDANPQYTTTMVSDAHGQIVSHKSGRISPEQQISW
jgi:hypothetical protein